MAPRAKKKTTTKVTAKKAAAPAKKVSTPVKDGFTKSQVMAHIAEETSLSKKDVQAVFASLEELMHRHLKKRGAGEFTVPGLMKCRIVRKPATKARKGINPFNGEETMFKAKPARNIVKIKPLKKLKEMAES
jgi:nucleoid DNA-binding protein